jgi:CDGSH-type Zn-finger protein
MSATRAWLADYTWEIVTAQNAVLCATKNALHKPTSDGHDDTKALWEANHTRSLRLDEAVELCRCCHRKAPFCFYN